MYSYHQGQGLLPASILCFSDLYASVFVPEPCCFCLSFRWSIVALQCFCCTAKRVSSVHTCSPVFGFSPVLVTIEHCILCRRFSLVICFIHSISSVYMSTPTSHFTEIFDFLICILAFLSDLLSDNDFLFPVDA